jgi:sugar phosphate isomerase/epimerase
MTSPQKRLDVLDQVVATDIGFEIAFQECELPGDPIFRRQGEFGREPFSADGKLLHPDDDPDRKCVRVAADPLAKSTLETFKRHGVHPQLWVMQSTVKAPSTLTDEQLISQNAARIAALHKLAESYGCRIGLYNHNGWFGVMDHQLAILERLRGRGVTDVGIVYNFSHARDAHHDDTVDFPSLWKKIKPHVIAVNVTGMRMDGQIIYPSQGDSELDMMRTIQESGWTGPVGVIAEKGGDAEVTLKNYLTGLEWLAAEIAKPGSAGPRPFAKAP